MDDCIFCKILNREIPAEMVYEDGYVAAFMDAFPIASGHVLVVPKDHSENFLLMPPASVRRIGDSLQTVAAMVKAGMKCDGVNVSTNVGKAAGQAVMHVHFHVIPRWEGDGLHPWPNRKMPSEDIKKSASAIRNGTSTKVF